MKRVRAATAAGCVLLAIAATARGATGSVSPGTDSQSIPSPPTSARCLQALGVACYSPAQIQRAYNLRPLYAKGLDGRGSTIVIVDPLGSPTIGEDLHAFDQALGLPDPPAFRVLQPVGPVPPFDPTDPAMVQTALETTLDVEWAHAIAPKANILLVETPVPESLSGGGLPQMLAAERYVVEHNLGDVISQSFSLPEQNFASPAVVERMRRTYVEARRRRVTVLAASNDFGVTGHTPALTFYEHRIVQWPASDPLVTAVGGTALHLDAAGRRTAPDSAWNDTWNEAVWKLFGLSGPFPWASNGGVSKLFRRPSYQDSVRKRVGTRRGVPDVSMSAAFSEGVLIFQSFLGQPEWGTAGGTSEATPEFAGIVAIADQYARTRLHRRRLGFINPALYRLQRRRGAGVIDIKVGDNTVTFPKPPAGTSTFTLRGYRARPGYDLVTGIGTIDAARFVPALARAVRAPVAADP